MGRNNFLKNAPYPEILSRCFTQKKKPGQFWALNKANPSFFSFIKKSKISNHVSKLSSLVIDRAEKCSEINPIRRRRFPPPLHRTRLKMRRKETGQTPVDQKTEVKKQPGKNEKDKTNLELQRQAGVEPEPGPMQRPFRPVGHSPLSPMKFYRDQPAMERRRNQAGTSSFVWSNDWSMAKFLDFQLIDWFMSHKFNYLAITPLIDRFVSHETCTGQFPLDWCPSDKTYFVSPWFDWFIF